MKHLQTGVIVEGTTNVEDIIEGLCDDLRRVDDPEAVKLAARFEKEVANSSPEHYDEILVELENEALSFAPDFTYFGNQEGDGACYGLWADVEAVSEMHHFGELPEYDDVDEDYEGLACNVTDHGNVSLLLVKGSETQELWSVV